jgi:4-hydroxybutyrate CoA-transferase
MHPGKVVGAFAMGTRRLYDFIDDNPQVVCSMWPMSTTPP